METSAFGVVHKLYSEERPATAAETKQYRSQQNKAFDRNIKREKPAKSAVSRGAGLGAAGTAFGALAGGKRGALIGGALGGTVGAATGARASTQRKKANIRGKKLASSSPITVNRDDEGHVYTGPSLGLNSKKVKSFSREVSPR